MSLLLGMMLSAAAPASDILHYVRSNRDGTLLERVVQFRPSRRDIAVYKWVEKCRTAAYVTARMDEAVREPASFTAGKVGRRGEQAVFGSLRVEEDGVFRVAVTPPGSAETHEGEIRPSLRPAFLYDFDLSDLNVMLQETRPAADFAFGLPLIWPNEDGSLFRDLGRVEARFIGEETRLGRRTRRFDLSLDGPPPARGHLWVDAAAGFIVEAELSLPNHQEYRDFRLRLGRVEPGSQEAWDALTRSHYADCPDQQ